MPEQIQVLAPVGTASRRGALLPSLASQGLGPTFLLVVHTDPCQQHLCFPAGLGSREPLSPQWEVHTRMASSKAGKARSSWAADVTSRATVGGPQKGPDLMGPPGHHERPRRSVTLGLNLSWDKVLGQTVSLLGCRETGRRGLLGLAVLRPEVASNQHKRVHRVTYVNILCPRKWGCSGSSCEGFSQTP